MTTYCSGFSDNLLGSHCLHEGDLALGREVSWCHAVYAANPCLVGPAILHLEPTDGMRGRDDGGKPRNKCYGIGHASSVFIELDPRNRGLASAESQPRGCKEAFLCIPQVWDLSVL